MWTLEYIAFFQKEEEENEVAGVFSTKELAMAAAERAGDWHEDAPDVWYAVVIDGHQDGYLKSVWCVAYCEIDRYYRPAWFKEK